MEPLKEGEWVILHQLNKKKLARIGQKGFVTLGKDYVSLEGAIGCLPWTNFKMEPHTGSKASKKMFRIVPTDDDDDDQMETCDQDDGDMAEEDRDNRTINDDGQSQSLSSLEIEALREGGLTGKEIVNHLVANSSTYNKKTRYAKSKYLQKKESKHCLREKISIRRTTLSSVVEVLCSGGGGEGSRGAISGMRPDTLSQMLTALNVQWKKLPSVKQKPSLNRVDFRDKTNLGIDKAEVIGKVQSLTSGCNIDSPVSMEDKSKPDYRLDGEVVMDVTARINSCVPSPSVSSNTPSGTTYVVYESGSWGLLVASLLTLLPSNGPRLIHLYPGHGVPCLIAPRALNLHQDNFSILSSVNFKALLEKLGESVENSANDEKTAQEETDDVNNFFENEENSEVTANQVHHIEKEESDEVLKESKCLVPTTEKILESSDHLGEDIKNCRKRKLDDDEEDKQVKSEAKKPRWQQEAELAAEVLKSNKADGLVVVACREHPVSIVISLLPYLAPSRPLVVYCPHREPLLDLYAVLKGWDPWTTRYGKCGGKNGIPRVANLRVTENWLRSYQVLPNRTHPEVNMTPGGGFMLTGVVIDFNDE